MRKASGSITLFSVVSLLLITAAIFALLEGTRFQELRRFAKLQTMTALESAFSNYNTCLWKNYRLLGTDKEEMLEIIQSTANGRNGNGVNLLQMTSDEIELESYTLLTDANGAVFVDCVATYMKENWVYEAAKEVYSQYQALKSLLDESGMDSENIENALEEIERIDEDEPRTSHGTSGKSIVETLREAKRWMEMGVLELFLKEPEEVSEATQDFTNGLMKRTLEQGKNPVVKETDWADRLLLQQYLATYMSYYGAEKDGRALNYELEYLLGGASEDTENLMLCITKLLGVREAVNFLYLLSNAGKVAQAEAMAATLAGASLNPAIVEAVTLGILTAWALAESILDVRALLQGKRIALMKDEESWTVSIENIGNINADFLMAKECAWGITYEDYLNILMLFEKEDVLANRAMSIQEATIRKQYGDSSFGMDSLITNAQVEISYSYQPVFPFLRVIDAEKRWKYGVSMSETYGYY